MSVARRAFSVNQKCLSQPATIGLCRLPWARDDVIPAGIAVAEALKAARARVATRDVVPLVTAAWNQAEVLRGKQPRLAPWIEVAEALVRRNASPNGA